MQVGVARRVRVFPQQAGLAEYEGCGPRAIVRRVVVAPVTTPSAVRFIDNLVTCGNNALDARRGFFWCYGPTITQHVCRVAFAEHVSRRICILLELLLLGAPAQHEQHYRKQ